MLNNYLQQTQRLLNDEQNQTYNLADLTTYVNIARGQIANQSETLLFLVAATLPAGQNTLTLTGLSLPQGAGQSLSIRKIFLLNGSARTLLEGRPWQWFENYYYGTAGQAGTPARWANLQQGSNGTIYFDATPAANVNLSLDLNCTPAALALDTDPELLSYPWTDAVPYYASYLALLNNQRGEDAAKMLQLYDRHMNMARSGVTPETMPANYPTKGTSQGGG